MAALASSQATATATASSSLLHSSLGAAASEGAGRTCAARTRAGALLRSEALGASLKAEARGTKSAARRAVCAAAALAGIRNPREDLLKDIEERWERIEKFPLEGVPFTYEEFEQALAKYDFNFNVGEKVKGIVFKSDNHGALIDIGAKAPAFLPTWESSMYKVKNVEEVGLVSGLEEEFMIVDEDDEKGRLILSLRKLQEELAWERCKQLLAEDVTIRGKVLDVNKGGLIVLVEGLRGFIPTSQVASRSPKELLLGKELPLKLMEVDEERVRLVLSNRKAAAESQISSFEVGDVVLGVVQAVKPYGAFIDVGGINGLLHISQISHDRLTNVESVLQEGDKLKVMILSHDRERGRLSFTTKKLEPTPGDMLRNPALVYEKAEEMASLFREQVARAEAVARAEDQQGFLQSSLFGFQRGPEEETKFDLSGL